MSNGVSGNQLRSSVLTINVVSDLANTWCTIVSKPLLSSNSALYSDRRIKDCTLGNVKLDLDKVVSAWCKCLLEETGENVPEKRALAMLSKLISLDKDTNERKRKRARAGLSNPGNLCSADATQGHSPQQQGPYMSQANMSQQYISSQQANLLETLPGQQNLAFQSPGPASYAAALPPLLLPPDTDAPLEVQSGGQNSTEPMKWQLPHQLGPHPSPVHMNGQQYMNSQQGEVGTHLAQQNLAVQHQRHASYAAVPSPAISATWGVQSGLPQGADLAQSPSNSPFVDASEKPFGVDDHKYQLHQNISFKIFDRVTSDNVEECLSRVALAQLVFEEMRSANKTQLFDSLTGSIHGEVKRLVAGQSAREVFKSLLQEAPGWGHQMVPLATRTDGSNRMPGLAWQGEGLFLNWYNPSTRADKGTRADKENSGAHFQEGHYPVNSKGAPMITVPGEQATMRFLKALAAGRSSAQPTLGPDESLDIPVDFQLPGVQLFQKLAYKLEVIDGSICQDASAACWSLRQALNHNPSIAPEIEESAVVFCCFWCFHVHPEALPADLKEEARVLELAYLERNARQNVSA